MSERVLHLHRHVYRDLSDVDLVRFVARHDSGAMEELFERHHERVHRVLARLRAVDTGDVDDLVQATFLEVQRSAARYGGHAAVGTWIVAIAVNVMRHHVRKEVRHRTALAALGREAPSASTGSSPFDASSNRQSIARLARAFDGLSRDHKEVFLLCDVEGLRGTEVARALDLPQGTVWRRLHEARMTLRHHLADKERP
jgi:RNA polymerase sigma-70 factor (ECF subfamily)